MNLNQHPHIADRLAAAYALGTLRGGARRRFEAQARQSPSLRALAITWQERFAAMTELQPEHPPHANVWKRIRLELDRQRDAQQVKRGGKPASRGWKLGAVAGAFATVASVVVGVALWTQVDRQQQLVSQVASERQALAQRNVQLAAQLQAAPEVRYVAVLADDKSSPSVLVTFDPKHNTLTLKRLAGFNEGEEKSLQLWALPPGGAPRSLGVLPQGGVARLTAAEGQVREVPALAISLEPKGGVPGEGGPTGPVLFKGALLPTS